MNRGKWMTSDERDMYHELLDEALRGCRNNMSVAASTVHDLLMSVEQAGGAWAAHVRDDAEHVGLIADVKDRHKSRHNAIVTVANGRQVVTSLAMGVRKRDDITGTVRHEQPPLFTMTWVEFDSHLEQLTRLWYGLIDARQVAAKIGTLRELSPESAGPGDAARALGVTLDEYLATGVA